MSTNEHGENVVEPPTFGSAVGEVVEIGPECKKHYIHKAFLVFHSEYFRKALQDPWKEARDAVVLLHDVGLLNLPDLLDSLGDSLQNRCNVTTMTLIKVYALGDRLLAAPFRRAINDWQVDSCLIIELDFLPDHLLPIVEWAFGNIPPDRVILQCLIDTFCKHWSQAEDDDKDKCT
ncbi:hypothetical protein BU25DRAFT_473406 [Macroventuria anomochaeta]|uniref:Uncharacterized protein n=1 Tax=Macroventuria anomochaeta TaxID=301207 RepID=A0ACB6RUL4_9PLEO|nr:uncharacterized protein BU25DRAFT_473406 [Macroventuria anomochaeta]KAF2625438.1 hypothetical protein BU25DRAFT_473406 [Macroventuria anomochaeta]